MFEGRVMSPALVSMRVLNLHLKKDAADRLLAGGYHWTPPVFRVGKDTVRFLSAEVLPDGSAKVRAMVVE